MALQIVFSVFQVLHLTNSHRGWKQTGSWSGSFDQLSDRAHSGTVTKKGRDKGQPPILFQELVWSIKWSCQFHNSLPIKNTKDGNSSTNSGSFNQPAEIISILELSEKSEEKRILVLKLVRLTSHIRDRFLSRIVTNRDRIKSNSCLQTGLLDPSADDAIKSEVAANNSQTQRVQMNRGSWTASIVPSAEWPCQF